MIVNGERNLSFIQNFFYQAKSSLPYFDKNTVLARYEPFQGKAHFDNVLRIYNIGNPGWSLSFYDNKESVLCSWKEIEVNITPDRVSSEEWFFAWTKYMFFDSGSSPLYLSVILESFRNFIEQKPFKINNLAEYRAKIKSQNPLLCWLEELYFSYCEWDDWGYGYGALDIDLMSFDQCWVMVVSMEEVDLCEKPFKDITIHEQEGIIELYKQGDKLVIKTYFRGLIKGISLFKEWVES